MDFIDSLAKLAQEAERAKNALAPLKIARDNARSALQSYKDKQVATTQKTITRLERELAEAKEQMRAHREKLAVLERDANDRQRALDRASTDKERKLKADLSNIAPGANRTGGRARSDSADEDWQPRGHGKRRKIEADDSEDEGSMSVDLEQASATAPYMFRSPLNERVDPKTLLKRGRMHKADLTNGTLGDLGPTWFVESSMHRKLSCTHELSESYPWWPAKYYTDQEAIAGPKIWERLRQERRDSDVELYLVQFYDDEWEWGILPLESFRILGKHEELDRELISPGSTEQDRYPRWDKHHRDCRFGYSRAVDDMEDGPDKEMCLSLLAKDK
ncbi:hypothetical protein MKEN_00455800 [Mycena kentingensis (nom. inval.)]|nr:hypothetical protein MKEN_00455800 [Mycena kentingensis (nom. inval.)]